MKPQDTAVATEGATFTPTVLVFAEAADFKKLLEPLQDVARQFKSKANETVQSIVGKAFDDKVLDSHKNVLLEKLAARVDFYAPVEEIGTEGRLLRACRRIERERFNPLTPVAFSSSMDSRNGESILSVKLIFHEGLCLMTTDITIVVLL
ncbi:hypothetical protein ACE6H2_010108 [Prunus campanulata]